MLLILRIGTTLPTPASSSRKHILYRPMARSPVQSPSREIARFTICIDRHSTTARSAASPSFTRLAKGKVPLSKRLATQYGRPDASALATVTSLISARR